MEFHDDYTTSPPKHECLASFFMTVQGEGFSVTSYVWVINNTQVHCFHGYLRDNILGVLHDYKRFILIKQDLECLEIGS